MKQTLKYSSLFALCLSLASSTVYATNICEALFGDSSGVSASEKERTPTMDQLLAEHAREGNPVIAARRLVFKGTEGRDVYNQTSRFTSKVGGVPTEVKLGRVEPRENHESEVWAFRHVGDNVYEPINSIAPFKGEDPFFSMIGSELWVGFVETYPLSNGHLGYRTVLYRDRGKGIDHLERAIELPNGMKDTRFAKVIAGPYKGQIRLVARPQNWNPAHGGRGKNAFIYVRSMADVGPKSVKEAKILSGQVRDGDWIGTNQVSPLANGDTVYLSHVAHYESEASGTRGYFVSVYSDRFPTPKIVLVRSDIEGSMKPVLARGGFKRPDLKNVLFSGGFRVIDQHTGVLDVGAGDAEAWEIVIPNFLTWYENQVEP